MNHVYTAALGPGTIFPQEIQVPQLRPYYIIAVRSYKGSIADLVGDILLYH
jgi:hypothetical protein